MTKDFEEKFQAWIQHQKISKAELLEVASHREVHGEHFIPSFCSHCSELIKNENGEIVYHYDIHNAYTRFCPKCRI